MSTRLFLVALAVAFAAALAAPAAAQRWDYGPYTSFAFKRFDGIYFPDTGLVYFLGGRLADASTDGSVWSFDPDTGVYADTGANLPFPVSNYTLNILEDSTGKGIYLVGGRLGDASYTHAVQVYYPATNTAVSLPADDWPAVQRIPGGVVAHGNKLYVFGGTRSTDQSEFSSTYVFDPSLAPGNRWSEPGVNLSQARGFIQTAVVNGYAYAIGGARYTGVPKVLTASSRCERLNLSNVAAGWDDASVRDLPTAVCEGRAFGFSPDAVHPLAGRIVVAGGGQFPSEWANCFVYRITDNSWSTFPSLVEARRDHAAAFVPATDGGEMWVFGGRRWNDNNALTTSERYVVAPPVPQGLVVTLSGTSLAAGDVFTVDVEVQPLAQAFDAWGCIFGPGASAWSFTFGNPTALREGTEPLVQDIPGLPAVYTGPLLNLTIPPGIAGEYTIVVELCPANLDPLMPIEGYASVQNVIVQ